jgi:hypothetical protein
MGTALDLGLVPVELLHLLVRGLEVVVSEIGGFILLGLFQACLLIWRNPLSYLIL